MRTLDSSLTSSLQMKSRVFITEHTTQTLEKRIHSKKAHTHTHSLSLLILSRPHDTRMFSPFMRPTNRLQNTTNSHNFYTGSHTLTHSDRPNKPRHTHARAHTNVVTG